ncbi:hypothetical protein AAFM46_05735 [Arthrobacter sp. TMP15]|uniref:hypothetical protein n=1 Tax=Arthrobacter sp. TMP15 TaxID=3140789 RepID=UPI0031BA2EE1
MTTSAASHRGGTTPVTHRARSTHLASLSRLAGRRLGSARVGSLALGSVVHGSLVQGSLVQGSLVQGSLVQGSLVVGSLAGCSLIQRGVSHYVPEPAVVLDGFDCQVAVPRMPEAQQKDPASLARVSVPEGFATSRVVLGSLDLYLSTGPPSTDPPLTDPSSKVAPESVYTVVEEHLDGDFPALLAALAGLALTSSTSLSFLRGPSQ